MEDEKALRAARFTEGAATNESDVSTDKSALDSKLEGSLDDIVKAQRQSRKEEMAKKKKETQNKQKQQKQQQQTQNKQNKQGKNSPAKFKQAAPVRGAAKPVSRQAVQQKSQQNNKPRQQQGRISQDESFARMNSSFNRQQQPKKSNDAKQAKRQEASLALIDPQEAAIRQQRADRFKQ
jgi:hypothetical protein